MESTRRPFDRSLSKEPGLKKPRLIEDSAAPDRISNGRAGFAQRSAVSNPGNGGGSRVQRDRDSENSDSVRGSYQQQPGQQLHQELVTQYKTALAELTFNSKPIITNLTIIAGESLNAAKAIAATICANILEVPREQKLPSLYLLDSIVKNIGRDYIKYFASRLPEVFCKAYRQVDPSIHQGMRHLFGTWKGVFPAQTLQMIEKELGFTTAANGSPPRTSRPDSQAQRPAHSIHVNPKYLEARQRLQTTRAKGAVSDTGGALVTTHEDAEALERTASISSGRSWTDSYAKSHHRDEVNEPVHEKSSSVAYSDSKYGSTVLDRSGLGMGRVVENLKETGYSRSWYESNSDVTAMSHQKNGFGVKRGTENFAGIESANSDSDLQLKQKISSRNTTEMIGNWKNSEEEEFMWDEMNSRSTVHNAADASTKDHWAPDNYDRMDFENHFRGPPNVHDIRSRDDDEASADSISVDLGQVASGTRMPLWSQKLHPPEGTMPSEGRQSISGYPEGYPTGLKNSQSALGRTHSQSQLSLAHIGDPNFKYSTNAMPGPKVSSTQHVRTPGAAASSTRPLMHQRPPSPSIPLPNRNQLLNNLAERSQTSTGPPTDPRRPPGQKNTGSRDQFSEDSLPSLSRDVYQASVQKPQPQTLRSLSTPMPPIQQRKHAPSAQKRNLEVTEFDTPSQISGSESRSTMGNSSSDQSNPLTVDSPSKSITSFSLDAVVKSGILSSSSLTGSLNKPNFQEPRPGSSLPSGPTVNLSPSPQSISLPTVSQKKVEHPLLPTGIGSEQTPSVVSPSNPVSSLLSSLVAKGLISSSKSDSLLSASSMIPDQPLDRVPAIASSSSSPVSAVPVATSKPLVSTIQVPSSLEPAVKASDSLPKSTEKIKHLIGFEFKPDVVRSMHPDVVDDLLSDLPHRCSICGLRLKLKERLDRHMEWHAVRFTDDDPTSKISRRWYGSVVDWVEGLGLLHLEGRPSGMLGSSCETPETSEQMVPADENQCACILCGELFEDLYSQERDEWMFKGAVYLTIPKFKPHERTGTTSDSAVLGPIVHANCISEDSIHDLGLDSKVKVENSA